MPALPRPKRPLQRLRPVCGLGLLALGGYLAVLGTMSTACVQKTASTDTPADAATTKPVDGAAPDGSDAETADARSDSSTNADAGTDGDAASTCADAGAGQPRAMWVWQTTTVTDATERDALFAFASARGITTLQVQISDALIPSAAPNAAPLASFIAEAKARCMSVEFLVGDPAWALADFRAPVVALATKAAAFSKALTGPKPTAFHLDIEPHAIKALSSGGTTWDWANDGSGAIANQRPGILNQFLDTIEAVRGALGNELRLHADVAFWLDNEVTVSPMQRMVNGAPVGTPRPASQLVIDAVDQVTVMAYRAKAFGNGCTMPSCSANGIYDLALGEIDYATTVNKRAAIGIETNDLGGGLSFYAGSAATMEQEIGLVGTALGGKASFAGFAIHDLVGYRALVAKGP